MISIIIIDQEIQVHLMRQQGHPPRVPGKRGFNKQSLLLLNIGLGTQFGQMLDMERLFLLSKDYDVDTDYYGEQLGLDFESRDGDDFPDENN